MHKASRWWFARVALACSLVTSSLVGSPASASPPPVGADPAKCPDGRLTSHAPIEIRLPADWTAANGVRSGSGTLADPYVISCLHISVIHTAGPRFGIRILQAGQPRFAFIIRDVLIQGNNGSGTGVNLGSSPSGTVERATVLNFRGISGAGISGSGSSDKIRLEANLLEGNSTGIEVRQYFAGRSQIIHGNVIRFSGGSTLNDACIHLASSDDGVVTENHCLSGIGDAFVIGSGPLVQGNEARGFTGTGFRVSSGTLRGNLSIDNRVGVRGSGVIEGNIIRANTQTGIDLGGGGTITANTIEYNGGDGIALFSRGARITSNVIQHNGGMGIGGSPRTLQSGASNLIRNNLIGHNAEGIRLEPGTHYGNLVEGTTWTDGRQSLYDPAYMNSVVDAGSDKSGKPGLPVCFDDYQAVVVLTPGNSSPLSAGFGGIVPAPRAVTKISWDFGDGTQRDVDLTDVASPACSQSASAPIEHTYDTPGVYTATLTVQALDENADPFSYSDTVQVKIV